MRTVAGAILDKYDLDEEIQAVRDLIQHRGVPAKGPDNLLVVTWNVQFFGTAKRTADDYALMAELIRPFDIAAIQELKNNLAGLRAVMQSLGPGFRAIFTDPAGNEERLCYLYDSSRVQTKELFAELAIPESQMAKYDPPDIPRKFRGFNRNPFLVTFQRGGFDLTLVNAHVYFGNPSGVEYMKRLVEVYALAKWAAREVKNKYAYENDIVLLGDMNVPKMDLSDEVFRQLTRFGFRSTDWSTKVGTNLDGTKHYDQVAICPKHTRAPTEYGVLNFDKHLFKSVWDGNGLDPASASDLKRWQDYCAKHLSDHRPLWVSFAV